MPCRSRRHGGRRPARHGARRERRPRRSSAASSSTTSCRPSAPGVYAIGECAEHRGACYGLVEPAYEQATRARRAARRAARAATRARCWRPTSRCRACPCSRSAISRARAPRPSCCEDQRAGAYRKLVVRDGRLAGAVLVGDTARRALVSRPDPLSGAAIAAHRATRSPSAGRYRGGRVMSGQNSPTSRSATSKASSRACRPPRRAGLEAARRAAAAAAASRPDPTPPHLRAPWRASRRGQEALDQEKAKRDEHPFDAYARLKAQARQRAVPQGRRQFPLALPRPVLRRARRRTPTCAGCASPTASSRTGSSAGVADIAETLRRRLRARDDARQPADPRDRGRRTPSAVLEACATSASRRQGSGADNIRNVTGSPTAGIDPQELIDTRPYARELAPPHPQRSRALRAAAQVQRRLRRRRRASRCWRTPTTSAFTAVERGDGRRCRAGRVVPARCSAASPATRTSPATPACCVRPEEARCRGRRHRARVHRSRRPHRPQEGAPEVRARRLGLREVPGRGRGQARQPADARCRRRHASRAAAQDRQAHIGVHPQKQAGLVLGRRRAAGRQADAASRCAAWPSIARELGDGDIRLTVWQNLLISGVAGRRIARGRSAAIEAIGLAAEGQRASAPASSPAPATPAASSPPSNTKGTRDGDRRAWCDGKRRAGHADQHPPDRLPPLLRPALHRRHRPASAPRCRCPTSDDTVEGYHILVGGGFGPDAGDRAASSYRDVKARMRRRVVERMLRAYLANRSDRRGERSWPSAAGTTSTTLQACSLLETAA